MAHQFTVYTKRDKIGSLTRPIKVLFTLLPAHSTSSYGILEFDSLDFGTDREEIKNIQWEPSFKLNTFKSNTRRGKTSVSLGGNEAFLLPGQCATMTLSPFHNNLKWSSPEAYKDGTKFEMSPIMAVNKTSSAQSIALLAKSPTQGNYWTMATFTLPSNETLVTQSRLILQAYVVDPSFNVYNVLCSEDLSEPLFTTPLRCETLPPVSCWRLSQSSNGKFHLRNDDDSDLGVHSFGTLARSIDDIKIQLGAVQVSLGSIQHRLDDIEEHQPSPYQSQNSGLDSRVSSLEEKAAKSDEFLAQNQDGLSRVQKFIQKLRPELAVMGRTLSTMESTTGALAAAVDQTRGDLAGVQTSLIKTGDRVTGLDGRVRAVEDRAEKLADALDEIRNTLPGAWPDSLEDSPILFPRQLPPEPPHCRI